MKRLLYVIAVIIVLAVPAYALSDAEFLNLKKDSYFMEADEELNNAYKEAQASMTESEFEKIKIEQRKWIKSGRDNEAKKLLKTGDYSKAEAYAEVTRKRARAIYGQIPFNSDVVKADDFIGTYYNDDDLCLTIWRDDDKPKKTLCVGFSEVRRNSVDMFGSPRGNVLKVEFDYDDTDLMNLLKYEAGIEDDGDLDLSAKLTMLGKNKIKVEASSVLNRLFNPTSGIFIRGDD